MLHNDAAILLLRSPNYTLHLFYILSLLCSYYVADLMQKLELCLTVVLVLLKLRFGNGQISEPKIGIPMSKTTSINPCFWFLINWLISYRSSHQKCSIKKVFLDFRKIHRTHLCQSLFFNKVSGLRPATLLKKRL